jgi:GntR family transcriptional regulator
MSVDLSTRLDQVKRHLIQYIKHNQLNAGDQLPSEADMAKMIGVSRNTVREAYISLESEGIIIRRHGIGTFLTRVPFVEEAIIAGFSSYPNRIRAAGYTPRFRTLTLATVNPPLEICQVFDIPPTEKLLFVERIILANDIPTVYMYDYMSPKIQKEQFENEQFSGDMIHFLANNLGLDLGHLHVKYQAVVIDQKISSHLLLPGGTPIISSHSILYAFDNAPIACGFSYLNPDIFDLDVVRIINTRRVSE